jgi:hypothetical protein
MMLNAILGQYEYLASNTMGNMGDEPESFVMLAKNLSSQISFLPRSPTAKSPGLPHFIAPKNKDPVEFNFKMPSFEKRALLFEKIHFFIEQDIGDIKCKGTELDLERLNQLISGKHGHLNYELLISSLRGIYINKLGKKGGSKTINKSASGIPRTNKAADKKILVQPVEEKKQSQQLFLRLSHAAKQKDPVTQDKTHHLAI